MSKRLRSTLCQNVPTMMIRNLHPQRSQTHSRLAITAASIKVLRRLFQYAQYACGVDCKPLKLHGIDASMSRKGNCLEHAPMESFVSSLRTALFERIDIFYNRPTTPFERRPPSASTSKDGFHRSKGCIGQYRLGSGSASNVT